MNNVFRPHTVDFSHVKYGMISGPTFTRNPNHVLELGCDNCELSHISVLNPPSTGDCEKKNACSHNTGAVDVHGSECRNGRLGPLTAAATLTRPFLRTAPFYIHNVNFTTGIIAENFKTLEARLRCPNIPAIPLRAGDDNVAVHANHTLVEDSYFGTGHGVIRHDIAGNHLGCILLKMPAISLLAGFHRLHVRRIDHELDCAQ